MKLNESFSKVSIIVDSKVSPAVRRSLNMLITEWKKKGFSFEEVRDLKEACGDFLLVVGVSRESKSVSNLLKYCEIEVPDKPESLLVWHTEWKKKSVLLVSGSDYRGLMYVLFDLTEQVRWTSSSENPFSEIKNTVETPEVIERALSIYTMNRKYFESRFYNQDYWAKYLDMLAVNRFNTFALLFAYESSGYFAPPYPYFFDVEGFPEVYVVGLSSEHQQRNLKALKRLVAMTHQRELNFTLGIWDQIYRGGVQQGPEEDNTSRWRVSGLTEDNLIDYSKTALKKLLRLLPSLDAIQFRMHGESGLKREEMDTFWENIYDIMREHGKDIRFDARAKGFPDHLIDMALEKGIKIRICTKYWMEQMGLPFHPTHIHPNNQKDRRHSYSDLLRYPQTYKIHWRLWNGGTSRVLLWGNPQYVRRFAQSTHLYDGEGFEVNEPLATKMAGHSHDMEPFELLNPDYQYYDYEFERYWHFFQVFGRTGYSSDTSSEVWEREFQRRFGKEAAPYVMKGLHIASRILPRIVAYNYPYNLFPTTRGWIEKQPMEDLPKYAQALPSDTQQFLSIDEAARNLLEGRESAKIHPKASSKWFSQTGRNVLQLVEEAENKFSGEKKGEFFSTMVDLKILANLSLYHSQRVQAGLSWALFKHSQDLNALDDVIEYETSAIEYWKKMVRAAGDVYHQNLMMGRESAGLSGHWKDELLALQKGLKELKNQREDFHKSLSDRELSIVHVPVRRISPGKNLTVRVTVSGNKFLTNVRVGYDNSRGKYKYTNMKQTKSFLYYAVIPGSEVTENFNYFVEAVDESGQKVTYPSKGDISVIVTSDQIPPIVEHTPINSVPAGKPLKVTAKVYDSSGVKWVRLRYRSVTQYQDFQTLPMLPTGKKDEYQAVIPGKYLDPKWDFMYLIEVMDKKGNGKIYPELETETPYVVVQLKRDK